MSSEEKHGTVSIEVLSSSQLLLEKSFLWDLVQLEGVDIGARKEGPWVLRCAPWCGLCLAVLGAVHPVE